LTKHFLASQQLTCQRVKRSDKLPSIAAKNRQKDRYLREIYLSYGRKVLRRDFSSILLLRASFIGLCFPKGLI